MRRLLALVILALCSLPAHAQYVFWNTELIFNGTAMTNTGYNLNSGTLFALNSASLNFTGAFSVAFWVKSQGGFSASSQGILETRGSPIVSGKGFTVTNYYNGNHDFTLRPINLNTASPSPFFCSSGGQACTRYQRVNDNVWHHVCGVWNGSNYMAAYIDGVLVDQNNGSATYVPNTTAGNSFWAFW